MLIKLDEDSENANIKMKSHSREKRVLRYSILENRKTVKGSICYRKRRERL